MLLFTSAFATLVPHIYWQCTTITYWLIVREEHWGMKLKIHSAEGAIANCPPGLRGGVINQSQGGRGPGPRAYARGMRVVTLAFWAVCFRKDKDLSRERKMAPHKLTSHTPEKRKNQPYKYLHNLQFRKKMQSGYFWIHTA